MMIHQLVILPILDNIYLTKDFFLLNHGVEIGFEVTKE